MSAKAREVLLDPLAALVTVEEIVPEGLDHGVERAGNVGDVGLSQQREHRAQEASRGPHLATIRRFRLGRSEIGTEEYECPVDEVNLPGPRHSQALQARQEPERSSSSVSSQCTRPA